MMNQQLCGINAIIFFTVSIFQSAGSSFEANTATIIVGTIQVVATIASAFVVNKAGRRPTLILTQAVMTLALAALGYFFYVKSYYPEDAANIGWIPIISMLLFVIAFGFGLGPLVWILLGELIVPRAVGAAGGLAAMVTWGLAFLVTVSFNYLIAALGDYGTYWLFTAFCILGMFGTHRYLPETKGKSIQEIQDNLRN